mmetsp:Transcript_11183/g.16745  ORF Transcript_11183/g.16745 Transcript_11183/m.16745 type:complete len:149 (+) Transcript_11183:459-905(+)
MRDVHKKLPRLIRISKHFTKLHKKNKLSKNYLVKKSNDLIHCFLGSKSISKNSGKYLNLRRELFINHANVTFVSLNKTVVLTIKNVFYNPNGQMFTTCNVISQHSIIELYISNMKHQYKIINAKKTNLAIVINRPEYEGRINAIFIEN